MSLREEQDTQKIKEHHKTLPDVTQEHQADVASTLDRVGMRGIEIPIKIKDAQGVQQSLPARVNFFVSLDDPSAKGIHMSRLYLTGQKFLEQNEFNLTAMKKLLELFIESHQGLSQQATAQIAFEYQMKRPALLSENAGWRFYPVTIDGHLNQGKLVIDLSFKVTYSSTCPCSAALSRQIIQEKFGNTFSGQDVISSADVYEWLGSQDALAATPHSQRSHANLTLRFIDIKDALEIPYLIEMIEGTLLTPVQTAVKREDEQEFARLNAQNLMFCEDAARKIKAVIEREDNVADYRIEVAHLESLHAHDAVAIVTKGVDNGLQP